MIQFENVQFTYTGSNNMEIGVHDIDLSIRAGECVLLCGRSGCGKTTLTKLINGLIPHYFPGELSGDVKLDGKSILETPMYQLANTVGSVFQNPRTQFFNVDVESEIAFGIENAAMLPDELHQRLEYTLDTLKIRSLQDRNIFELSGGEKQKVAFASVYAMNPDVFLLDEPSSNLDMASIEELRSYLQILKKQNKTILIAEHRLYYLLDIADRIIYLADGKIEAVFAPQQLQMLPEVTRKNMGLRAVDMQNVHPVVFPKPQAQSILTVKDVTLFYKKRPVLEHISLQAAKGDIIGVVGPNGAGKTTFLRTLCGLHKEYTGCFCWQEQPQKEADRMKRSYMVMQDVNYELFADSVEAECSFGIQDVKPELIEKTLERLGLLTVQKRHPNTLSGGQKQRVAVAVSMICGKEVIVFDEPTSGLDYDSMEQVSNLIRELSKQKVIFVVTHDYEFVCQTCTRLLRFDHHTITDDFSLSDEKETAIRTLMGIGGTKDEK